MKSNSLKTKFRNTFVKIIALSLVATTISFLLWTLFFNTYLYPAAHFEQKIPAIENFIGENGDSILNPSFKEDLEAIIPLQGMDYQVLDRDGRIIYSSIDKVFIANQKDFINSLNKNIQYKNNFFSRTIPITDDDGLLKGGVLLNYQLEPKLRSKNKIYSIVSRYFLFIPILYVVFFTIYYSNKLSREINKPLDNLMDAVEKIANKNLDFSIKSDSSDEIGQLSNALEDMRMELKSSLEEQWRLEDKRKENLSNLAHDLKTPLTIVSTYSEALLYKDLDREKQLRYIKTIDENNRRAIDMIFDISELINIENPNYSLNPLSLDIGDYFTYKFVDYNEFMIENNISYNHSLIDRRETISEKLYDIKAINQVLDNIVSNSIRFSQNESIDITVDIFDEYFNISVVDTGRGFSNEDLKCVFDKFYRGDSSRSSKTGNSGLGMFISKSIVNLHKGDILAKNNSPKGAIIELNISSL